MSRRVRGRIRGGQQKNRYGMNRLEERYSEHLEEQKREGKILDWWFEPITLRLTWRSVTSYKPDFLVVTPDGFMEFHETKGFMEEDAWQKLKFAADMYWMYQFRLVRSKGKGKGWDIKEVG